MKMIERQKELRKVTNAFADAMDNQMLTLAKQFCSEESWDRLDNAVTKRKEELYDKIPIMYEDK
jgi:hypothetical protein